MGHQRDYLRCIAKSYFENHPTVLILIGNDILLWIIFHYIWSTFEMHSLTPLVWTELFCITEIILLHIIKLTTRAAIHHTWESLLKKYHSISFTPLCWVHFSILLFSDFVAFITWTCGKCFVHLNNVTWRWLLYWQWILFAKVVVT